MADLPAEIQKIEISNTTDSRKGAYSNTLQVSITASEVTLDFIYLNQNDNPAGTLASRVIVSRKSAALMAESLRQIVATANEVNPE